MTDTAKVFDAIRAGRCIACDGPRETAGALYCLTCDPLPRWCQDLQLRAGAWLARRVYRPGRLHDLNRWLLRHARAGR